MTPVYTNSALDNAWPFWVLELPITATNADIEKAARNISAKLQLNAPGADTFTTPNGKQKRDEFLVREAKSELQTPSSRLMAEFWYLAPIEEQASTENAELKDTNYWLKALGTAL